MAVLQQAETPWSDMDSAAAHTAAPAARGPEQMPASQMKVEPTAAPSEGTDIT